MVKDAAAPITIKVVGGTEGFPLWILAVAGGLSAVAVVAASRGKKSKKGRKKR